jgi:2-polyprenyl-3-methyl-5-hydroxy-6-metoxy-1,4-benzoquinol methylase
VHEHAGPHENHVDMAMFSQATWDDRYGSSGRIWSGNPNPLLVAAATELTPGAALDVGCGEGADAIWLASQGWHVTGIDISAVALNRAAGQAAIAGPEIADRITWQQADLFNWVPPAAQFDLVSAQFMQLPAAERASFHRRLAEAVRPGGVLLIVRHHPSDLDSGIGRPHHPELMFTAEQVASTLDPAEWSITVAGARQREATTPDGVLVTISDALLQATRLR